MFKPRKVFIKVSETTARKGIETFSDSKALSNFDPAYKGQLISFLQVALEILIGERIIINIAGGENESGTSATSTGPNKEESKPGPIN